MKKEGIEKSIKATGATFTWGANCFDDLGDIAAGFRKVKDDNIVRGMLTLTPLYGLVTWMPIVKKFAQKILVFEKSQSEFIRYYRQQVAICALSVFYLEILTYFI